MLTLIGYFLFVYDGDVSHEKKNTKYGQNSPRSWDPISLTLHYPEFRKRVGVSNAISVAIVTNPSFIFLLSGPMVATLPAVLDITMQGVLYSAITTA